MLRPLEWRSAAAAVAFLLVVSALITWGEIRHWARHPGFYGYCEAGHYPRTWVAAGRPAWATEERLALLCAVAALARAELGLTVEED